MTSLPEGGNRYLFYSHDGYGLGHARRNTLIARAVLDVDPGASITLITGVAARPAWLEGDPRIRVVRVPPLLKNSAGAYRGTSLPFEDAVACRAQQFLDEVRSTTPDVIVVDRHPYGTAGELTEGLLRAHDAGAAIVLGLRDVLDESSVIREEIAGRGWAGVADILSATLIYGAPHVVDHEAEYGLPVSPQYCGWVGGRTERRDPEARTIAIAAGGGGDGAHVFSLGRALLALRPSWHGVLAPGPYAQQDVGALASREVARRLDVVDRSTSCGPLFARAQAVLCMAGYNSTVEALAAGRRPILVPRRSPRREQAIRAWRFSALGLADVVDEGAAAAEVEWLLDRERNVSPVQLEAGGISLDGAACAAGKMVALAHSGSRR